jgi:hypothetical protein
MTRSGRKKRRSCSLAIGHSPSYKLRKTLRSLWPTFSVRSDLSPLRHVRVLYVSSDEQALRAKIAKLQEYRRLGLRTAADIDAYQSDLAKRVSDDASVIKDIDLMTRQVEAKAKYPGYQAIDRRARGSVGPFGLGDDGSYGSREPDGKFGSASAGPVVRKGRQLPSIHSSRVVN